MKPQPIPNQSLNLCFPMAPMTLKKKTPTVLLVSVGVVDELPMQLLCLATETTYVLRLMMII